MKNNHDRDDQTPDADFRGTSNLVPVGSDLSSVQTDLARIHLAPGFLGRVFQSLRIWDTKSAEIDTLKLWTDFYKQAEELVRAKTAFERANLARETLPYERSIQRKTHELTLAGLDCQLEDAALATDKALRVHAEFRNPPEPDPDAVLIRQKESELRVAELDTKIARLDCERAGAEFKSKNIDQFVVPEVDAKRTSPAQERAARVRAERDNVGQQIKMKLARIDEIRRRVRKGLAKIEGLEPEERERLEAQLLLELDEPEEEGRARTKTL